MQTYSDADIENERESAMFPPESDPVTEGWCNCADPLPRPYVGDGPLGHGWECGRCGGLLQVG